MRRLRSIVRCNRGCAARAYPLWVGCLPQPATPGKYQDSYHPIPREPPTDAMVSPYRRLSPPQPASNARHPARPTWPLLTAAILNRRALALSELARPWMPGLPQSHHQRKKRHFRFLSNPRFDPIQTQCALMPAICQLAGLKGLTPIMIDWSRPGPQAQRPFRRRLLPQARAAFAQLGHDRRRTDPVSKPAGRDFHRAPAAQSA